MRIGRTHIALILAGTDKFLNAMIDWVQYLAPVIPRTVGIAPEIFLRGVGIVEIALGILIAFVPRRAAGTNSTRGSRAAFRCPRLIGVWLRPRRSSASLT